jgi:FkbM family methyltransferase
MLTHDEIIWGYRYVLGRDPRPDEVSFLTGQTIVSAGLRTMLLGSEEFAAHEKVIGHTSKWVITEVFEGSVKMWIDLADKYVSYGCLIDNYEPLESTAFRRLLQPGFHVVDLGANVGWFTFLATLGTGPTGRVTAIEPRNITADYLRRSVQLNRLEDRVTVIQHAIGDHSGKASLVWYPASRNPGSARLGEPDEGAEAQETELRRLDEVLGESRVDCIKMDIEGAEGLALIGAAAVLRSSRPFVLCEINPSALWTVSAMSVEEFLRLVRAQQYVPFSIEDSSGLARLEGSPELGGREVINVVLAHEGRLPL